MHHRKNSQHRFILQNVQVRWSSHNWFYLQNYWRNTSILSSVMGNHFFTKYVWNKYKPLTTNCARTRRQFTWTQSCVQLHKEWLAGLLHARQHPLNDCTECVEIQHRTVTGLPKGKRSSVHSTTLPSLYFETLQSNSSYYMKTKSFNRKLVHLYLNSFSLFLTHRNVISFQFT